MEVEILFQSSSTPKKINARAVYTKGALLCVEVESEDRVIIKYPLCNIFSIAHKHGGHIGSEKKLIQD